MIRVGILGLSRREGTFAEVGLRSWEEAGCAAVERTLMTGNEGVYTVHRPLVLRSARAELERILRDWCDAPNKSARCDLILTVGGTGYSDADVMPEATQPLLKRGAQGIIEALRRAALEAGQPQEAVSRGVAGMRGRTLLINLPGNVKGMADEDRLILAMQTLLPFLPDILAAIMECSGNGPGLTPADEK